MPVAVANAPWTKLGHTRNPNWLQLYTTEVLAAGTAAQWSITFTSGTGPTTTVEITVGDQVITMYGTSLTPGDSGLEFARDASTTVSATNFAAGCLANPWFGLHFLISATGSTVTFSALKVGVAYNLGGVVFTNTTGSSTTAYTGADRSIRPNFSVNIRPWVEQGGNFLPIGDFSAEPLNGQCELDLGSKLDPYLGTDMLYYGYTTSFIHSNSLKRYFVQYWERFGASVGDRALYNHGTLEAPHMAWYAGHSRSEALAFDQFVLDNTLSDPADNPRFFTWRNRGYARKVSTTEQHSLTWFSWYTPPAGHNVALQARITYTDANGSNPVTTNWTNRYVTGGVQPYRLYTFPTGYAALNLAAVLPANKVLQSYDVRLFAPTDSVVLCETITFHLAKAEWNEKHILFWSSLGATESLRCTGAWSEPVEATNLETYRPQTLAMRGDAMAPSYRTVPGTAQRTLTVFTGYHALQEQEALLDILNSPDIRLVDHENERHLPLRLLESNAVAGKRGTPEEHLHGLELTFLADDPQALVTITP
jgi:hypothetical protein